MTKTRIREIREKIRMIEDDAAALLLGECLREIEHFQKFTRRGEPPPADIDEPILDDEPASLPLPVPPAGQPKKSRGTLDEFKAFAKSIGLPESDGETMFWKFEASGWKNGRNPVKDWRAVMRQWKAAGYHPSQNQRKPMNGNGHQPPQRTGPAQMIL